MRRLILLLLVISSCSFVIAQTPSKPPCSDPVYRQFDFWIGEWEVYGPKGKKAGDSKIELILDSCVIQENWTSANLFQGKLYSGKSYNSYNSGAKKWQQFWVDNTGSITAYFDGHYEDNKMIMLTDNVKQPDGTYKIQKMTFFHLGPDKVRQFGESSTDGGKTWKTDFDLEYRRKK